MTGRSAEFVRVRRWNRTFKHPRGSVRLRRPLAIAATVLTVGALAPDALADTPQIQFPETGTFVEPGEGFQFEAPLGYLRVQFSTNSQFTSIECDTGWALSPFDSTITWEYPGPITPSETSCPLGMGTHFWRAGWSAEEFPSTGEEEWSEIRSVVRPAATITGTTEVGQTLTATPAGWPGPPPSYSYQWQRCASELYATEVLRDGPAAYYRLGDAVDSTSATDSTGNENLGTFRNGIGLETTPALIDDADSAAALDGVDDYLDVPDAAGLDLGDAFTLEAWIRPNGAGFTGQVIQKGSGGYGLRLTPTGALVLEKALTQDVATTQAGVSVPLDGLFHHVVATKNAAVARIFLDGVDVTAAGTNATVADTAIALQIGRTHTGANYFRGDLDEVAVYRGALPPVRVRGHYDIGASGCLSVAGAKSASYQLVPADFGSTMRVLVTATVGGAPLTAPSAASSSVDTQVPVNTEAPVNWGEAVVGSTVTGAPGAWAGNDPLTFSYQWQSCQDRQYGATVLADSPAGYWRLGEASGAAVDSSGNGNPGSYTGGVTRGVQGALMGSSDTNRGVRFDGINDYVSVQDDNTLDLGDSFTIEEWVRRNASGVKGQIVAKGANGYALRIEMDDLVYLAKANVGDIAKSSVAIPTDGNYHHVVATKNGATTRIYVDGVDVTSSIVNRTIANTATELHIGRFYNGNTGSNYLDGDLDDVAVYNAALTAARVKVHYDMGTSGCLNIPGATAVTYSPLAGDAGKRLRLVVTGTNGVGSSSASSARTSSAVLSSGAPVVAAGTLTDAAGAPITGATVSLWLWPADLDAVPEGSEVPTTLITQSTTDSVGRYHLRTPMTAAIQAEADQNGGFVDFEIDATVGGMGFNKSISVRFAQPDNHTVARLGSSLASASAAWYEGSRGVQPQTEVVALRDGEPNVGLMTATGPPTECPGRAGGWLKIRNLGDTDVKIGEMLTWGDNTGSFWYGKGESSTIERGLKIPNNPWQIGGRITLSKENVAAQSIGEAVGTFQQRVILTKFKYAEFQRCGYAPRWYRRQATRWAPQFATYEGGWIGRAGKNGHCEEVPPSVRLPLDPGDEFWRDTRNNARFFELSADFGPITVGSKSGYSEFARAFYKADINPSSDGATLCGLVTNPAEGSERVYSDYKPASWP